MSNAQPRLAHLPATVLGFWLLTSATVGAQVLNPRVVEFIPSPDHAAMLDTYTPTVTNYVLEVYQTGAAAPFYSMDLGKPDPDPDGLVRYDFSWQVESWPLPGGYYQARVAAQGPYGSSRSAPSNEFVLVLSGGQVCYYVLSTTSMDVASWGEARAFSIAVPPGCPWTVTSDSAWLTPTNPSGTGSATIQFSVTPNPGPTIRTGGLTIAGRIVAVTQALAPPGTPTGFTVVGTQK
jgi:hypothetical protein